MLQVHFQDTFNKTEISRMMRKTDPQSLLIDLNWLEQVSSFELIGLTLFISLID